MELGDIQGGFNGVLGLELTEVSASLCLARIEIGPHHLQPYGIVHGGVYAALIEVVASMGAAVFAAELGIPGAVGVNNNTDFIKATRSGVLIATGTPIHQGRTQQLWSVAVTDEDEGRLRAQGKVRLANITNPDTVGSA